MSATQPGGLDTFLRMAGLYGPQDDSDAYAGMPPELPVGRGAPPLINRRSTGVSIPDAYGGPEDPMIDEEVTVGADPNETLNAFRTNVLNPPQRQHMTYPKNTLAGLDAAFKIAAEPSEASKNRVMVDGNAYQKQKVVTDKDGKKHYMTGVQEPSFMENVMRAMPAAISPAVDILNQPHEDAVTDWQLKNEGLKQAAGAESAMALANQRNAAAAAQPAKTAQAQEKIDISRLTAEEKVRASQLNTLSDVEKIDLLQSGKITMADINNAAAMARAVQTGQDSMARTVRGGEDSMARTVRSGQDAMGRTIQTGANQQANIAAQGANTLANTAAVGANQQANIAATGANQQANIAARGTIQQQLQAARQAAGSTSGANASEYQQKVGLQNRTAQLLASKPEWGEHVTFDPRGFPVIASPDPGLFGSGPDKPTYDAIYNGIYGAPITAPIPARRPAGAVTPAARTTAPPTAAARPAVTPPNAPATPTSGSVRVISPTGKKGTWDLSKGPIPNGFKKE